MKTREHHYLVRCVEQRGYWDVLVPAIGRWTTVYAKDQIVSAAREMLTEQGAEKFRVSLEDIPARAGYSDGLTPWHPAAAPSNRFSLAGSPRTGARAEKG